MPIEFYGATIIDDPVLGKRPLAFLKQTDNDGKVQLRAFNVTEDIRSSK